MRLNRVLVADLSEPRLTLRGAEAHHLRDVLRLKAGAEIEAFDGVGNVAGGLLVAVDRDGVSVELSAPRRSPAEPALELTVAVALLKGDKLADVVRQCTELGAARFVLVGTRHADAASLSPAKLQRLERIAEEASRQSGRARVPRVDGPLPLGELGWEGPAVVADPRADRTLAQALRALREPAGQANGAGAVTLVSGPEGGLAAAEVDELTGRGAVAVTLGPLILRAETAPVALAAATLLGGA